MKGDVKSKKKKLIPEFLAEASLSHIFKIQKSLYRTCGKHRVIPRVKIPFLKRVSR